MSGEYAEKPVKPRAIRSDPSVNRRSLNVVPWDSKLTHRIMLRNHVAKVKPSQRSDIMAL